MVVADIRRVFGMIKIQSEKEEYYTAIYGMNVLAFGRENEARLVENLRRSPDFIPELSLVAAKDKMIVGHILFSRIAIQTKAHSFLRCPLHLWVFIRSSKNRVLAPNLYGRDWYAAENWDIKLLSWLVTQLTTLVLGLLLPGRKGLKRRFLFLMKLLW
jgi:hypothetical protein